jgi:hypothetical protein
LARLDGETEAREAERLECVRFPVFSALSFALIALWGTARIWRTKVSRAAVVPTTSLAGMDGRPLNILAHCSYLECARMFVQSQSVLKSVFLLQFSPEAAMTEDRILTRPFLLLACICERHILEGDGTLTLFRIIDRFTVQGQAEEFPLTTLNFTMVVKFASGAMRGRANVSLSAIDPDKQPMQSFTFPILFEGEDERGTQLLGQFALQVKQEGLYWIKVLVEQEEYTRIPFRVVYQRQPTIQMAG